ncbi:unnamed protein product [Prorocentrum cordatum]|uniref:Uncharacterized protein n=1 Tax=Prorocentrum cordatum TaxID=2364126 RepID=A0ABN9T699_9DINO|nr:unnamed protein product [Polarella glacialis]
MSWLMGPQAAQTGEKDAKRGKTKESDDVVTKKMIVQPGARMRVQGHYAMTQVHLSSGRPLVNSCQAQYQSYRAREERRSTTHARAARIPAVFEGSDRCRE